MIARYTILLPFDLLIREGDQWPELEVPGDEISAKIHPPTGSVERPGTKGSVFAPVIALRDVRSPEFADTILVGGCRTALANVFQIDFLKAEFDRATTTPTPDPPLEFAFEVANHLLARLRVYARAFDIKPLQIGRDAWRLQYLSDAGQELEREEGKLRERGGAAAAIGFPAITPDVLEMVATRSGSGEPYVWDQLLLDAFALLPEAGSAVVMAYSALETFISWGLEVLHERQQLPNQLWTWINKRDHWTKEPSVSEQFDALLRVFTGRSLKEENELWEAFTTLRKARNALAHEGTATAGGVPVDGDTAHRLVNSAAKIVKWVEELLPEDVRRARSEATGPFTRRLATPKESVEVAGLTVQAAKYNQGPIRVLRRT